MKQDVLSSPAGSYKWVILIIATISQTFASFVMYGVGPLASLWQQMHHLSQFQTGLLVSAVNIGPIFSMLVFGNLMDQYGERWIVGLGSILLGASMFLVYTVTHYAFLLIILIFVGIWYGPAQPGGSKAIVKWFPSRQRGLAMGIRQTGIPFGGALASMSLPLIFSEYGFSSVIFLQAFVAVIGGFIFILFYRDEHSLSEKGKKATLFVKLKTVQGNHSLYPVFFIGITMVSLQLVIVAHLMSYLSYEVHITLNRAGVLLSTSLIGGMVGRILLAWVSDKLFKGNRATPLQITIWMTVFVVLCMSFFLSYMPFWLLTVSCFWLGFLGIGWYSLFIVLVSEKSDPRFIGLTVSLALTLNQFAIVLAPAIFGILVDTFHSYAIAFSALAIIIAFGGVWFWINEQRKVLS